MLTALCISLVVNVCFSFQMPNTEFEFENDQKEIGFYSVEDGDIIHVKW